MNTEKINAAAEKYASYTASDVSGALGKHLVKSCYTDGISYAAENPDVIGCVTAEEALRFAEWIPKYYFGCSDNKRQWWEDDFEKQYTTAELFDIFKQQKP